MILPVFVIIVLDFGVYVYASVCYYCFRLIVVFMFMPVFVIIVLDLLWCLCLCQCLLLLF